jgi:hypothetical protein
MGLFFYFYESSFLSVCMGVIGLEWNRFLYLGHFFSFQMHTCKYAFSPCRVVYICGVRFGFSLDWITFLVMSLFVCPFCSPPTLIIPVIRFACIYCYLRTKGATVYLYPLGLGTWFFFPFLFLFPLIKLRGRDSTVRWIKLLKLIFVILILQIFRLSLVVQPVVSS